MVNKRLLNLNRDLDKYLSRRQRQAELRESRAKLYQDSLAEISVNNKVHEHKGFKEDDSAIYENAPSDVMDAEAQKDFEELEIQEHEKQKPFFSRMFDSLLRRNAEDAQAQYEPTETTVQEAAAATHTTTPTNNNEASEDLRKALRIALSAMENMVPRDFDKFKKSSSFKDYKELLRKYNIKKL